VRNKGELQRISRKPTYFPNCQRGKIPRGSRREKRGRKTGKKVQKNPTKTKKKKKKRRRGSIEKRKKKRMEVPGFEH